MIAVLSPAKRLDYEKPLPELTATVPRFESEAAILASAAADLSAERLAGIMDISDNLATLNADRFSGFAGLPTRPALYAFAGDVYLGFEPRTLDRDAIDFAQGHVRILSGLYGLLRPLDEIRPHLLEMGTRWAPGSGTLYGFWGKRVADLLARDAGGEPIVNLAGQEYWGVVEGSLSAEQRVITIDFGEIDSVAAKRASGMMARFICEHRLTDPEALKNFAGDSHVHDPAASTEDVWRFVRS